MINHLIEDLRHDDVFVMYKLVEKDGRMTKPPLTTWHTYADKTNAEHWTSYENAIKALKAFKGSYAGIGAVLKPDMMRTFVDFDKCVSNGEIINPLVKKFVERANTYFELSPSGTGLHGHFNNETPFDPERKRHREGEFGYEVYTKDAYHTITQQPFCESKPVRTISNNDLIELLKIVGYPWKSESKATITATIGNDNFDFYDVGDIEDTILPTGATSQVEFESDDDLLSKMFSSKIGGDLKAAYDGTLRGNHSDTDFAFVKSLAWWTRHDRERVKRIFLASPTAQRQKAQDRADYFDTTYNNALKALAGKMRDVKRNPTKPAQPAQPMPDDGKTSQEGGAAIVVARESDDSALLETNRTSAGMGDNFVKLHGENIKFETSSEQWIAYLDHRWQYDTTRLARRLMRQTAQRGYKACVNIKDLKQRQEASKFFINSETDKAIGEALKSAATNDGMQVNIADFDNDPFLANAGDYTLDLKNCYARPSRKEDFLTLRLGATFDKDAKCPRWRQFISEIFPSDELGEFFQRCAGYSLTGDMREQKLFLLHGDGANGKSLALRVLGKVAGDYGTAMPSSTFDADERSNVQQELFEARGKRFIAVVETDENKRLSEGLVKSLTGQDLITARKLFSQPIKYYPTFKFWIAMNHLPRISGIDTGIWRRLILIPFTQSFLGREEKGLEDVLMSEASGILNWILEGVVNWHKHGLKPPQSVIDAVSNYRKSEDITAQWLGDCARLTGTGRTQSQPAFENFLNWAKLSNVKTMVTNKKFSLMLQAAGYEKKVIDGRKYFCGFELITPN